MSIEQMFWQRYENRNDSFVFINTTKEKKASNQIEQVNPHKSSFHFEIICLSDLDSNS